MGSDRAFGEQAGDADSPGRIEIDPRYSDGALFDLDGVIADTAAIHQAAWTQVFDEYLGRRSPSNTENHGPFTSHDYRRLIDGRPRYDGVRDFLSARGIALPWGSPTDNPGDDTICALGNRKRQLFLDRIARDGVPVFASTIALVRLLRDAGVQVGVFSASRNGKTVLESAGIEGLFDARVDGGDASEAARRLGVRPGRVVVIDDSPDGVLAARAGGFGLVIGVDRGGDGAELRTCGADAVVGDLSEVQAPAAPRRMSMLPDALASFDQLATTASARRPAFFFDFDGTLSPIVDDPAAAALVPGVDRALRSLAELYPVAVLSGRDLADIRERVGIKGLWYAGSHGFEMVSPGGSYHRNETAAQAIPVLEAAADELGKQLAKFPGVAVEHKRYAVAVHYRNAEPDAGSAVTAAVHSVGKRLGLKVTAGRKVVELRPNLDWHKGKTLEWILDQVAGEQSVVPIFVGDDLTDEDGFDAVQHDGVGIVVRHTEDGDRATGARFSLDDPRHVREFIERFTE